MRLAEVESLAAFGYGNRGELGSSQEEDFLSIARPMP